jgi:hypothetical protein
MVLNNIGESSISLADLRSRRVPVEWFEAVAVIQGLSRVLLESGGDPAHASLAPQDVSIDAAGSVRVTANPALGVESVVRRVGELLQISLADSAFPVPLRLVIMQSVATPPSYASLAELASALEYFERPDRPALIRAVYERAQGYQPVSEPAIQPTQQTRAEDVAPQPNRQRRRLPARLIAVSVAAVIAVALGLAISLAWTRLQVVAPVADQPKPAPVEESPRASSVAKAASATPVLPSARQIATNVAAQGHAAQTPSFAITPATMDVVEPMSVEAIAPEEAVAIDVDVEAETTVYSVSNEEVTPPIATYPRLPAQRPVGVRADDVTTLELLVDETGNVQSVKLVGRPHHLGEALLATLNLSAAKTWRFRPAVKDGRAVRYRTFVQVWPTTR